MKKGILLVGIVGVLALYTLALRGQRSNNVTGATTGTNALSSSGGASSTNTGSGSSASTTSATATSGSSYKDGTFTGASENAFYGNVQVAAIISGGKIVGVNFLSYPNDNPNSQSINSQATPILKQEALKVQSANVDVVSGATLTSQAFAQSLQSALQQAKA